MHENPSPLLSHPKTILRLSSERMEISMPSFPEFIVSSGFITVASHFGRLLPDQNVVLTYVRGEAPYPSGYSLPLLGSASLLALALVHALSVPLLRPVSSLLLSFACDVSPSVNLPALPSRIPRKTTHFSYRALNMIRSLTGASVRLHEGQQR